MNTLTQLDDLTNGMQVQLFKNETLADHNSLKNLDTWKNYCCNYSKILAIWFYDNASKRKGKQWRPWSDCS